MDCSMCPNPIPEPRRLAMPITLTCSPECARERDVGPGDIHVGGCGRRGGLGLNGNPGRGRP